MIFPVTCPRGLAGEEDAVAVGPSSAALPWRSRRVVCGVSPRNMVSLASSAFRSTIVGVLLSIIVSLLARGYRLRSSVAARRERPQVALPGEADHFHLPIKPRAGAFGDS